VRSAYIQLEEERLCVHKIHTHLNNKHISVYRLTCNVNTSVTTIKVYMAFRQVTK